MLKVNSRREYYSCKSNVTTQLADASTCLSFAIILTSSATCWVLLLILTSSCSSCCRHLSLEVILSTTKLSASKHQKTLIGQKHTRYRIATWCCTFNTLAAFLTSVIHNHALCFSMRTHVAGLQRLLTTFSYHHCKLISFLLCWLPHYFQWIDKHEGLILWV